MNKFSTENLWIRFSKDDAILRQDTQLFMTGSKPLSVPYRSWQWLIGFIRISRSQNLVMLALTQYFTAYFLVDVHHSRQAYLLDIDLFMLVASTVMIAAAGYMINDYYDVKIDFINKPQRVVVGTVLRRRIVIAAHVVLTLLGILMGGYLSWKVGIIHLSAAFLLWWYSNQLKRYPFIGNFSIAALSGLAIAVIGFYYQQQQFLVFTYALFAFSISLLREIIKDMEDVQGDESFGCQTLPIVWGISRTKILLYVLSGFFIFLLFFLSGTLGNRTLIIYFLLLIAPIAYFITKLVYADTKRDFAYLSDFCKLLMLSGILSMAFF